ncbi:MAG: toll/interleukin-1 receptor domain-containing protein, partial [Clostridia bacterium]|nr:toll/interleukin-1 receptor domain-containing protein [Clostridia bacterium]
AKGCRIPTCHRTSVEAITADHYYKSAIEHATPSARAVYEEEAAYIDSVQKEILAISAKEAPYDVFICYKESDESGKRTQDSVIANDIYHQLSAEGFKVFYAAITLEDKLGMEYEPVIYAALNSSRVMLAIGTRAEYFNAVWVKNEWSRFLKMMKGDRKKLLIPCYRDMDAYDLPEEFAHLQAQDMSKIGFINDIVRGIKKVMDSAKSESATKTVVKETVVSGVQGGNIAPLLKRAFIFLEDGQWKDANSYFEKVLDMDPECSDAYLGQLLATWSRRTRDSLSELSFDFSNDRRYKNALKFADEKQRKFLEDSLKSACTHYKINSERERIDSAKKKVADLNTEIEKNNSELLFATKKAKEEKALADKIYHRGKKGAFLNLFGLFLFILSICVGAYAMDTLGSNYFTFCLRLMIVGLVSGYTYGVIGLAFMILCDIEKDHKVRAIIGFSLIMILCDIVGIIYVFLTFTDNKYNVYARAKKAQEPIPHLQSEKYRLQSLLNKATDELEQITSNTQA